MRATAKTRGREVDEAPLSLTDAIKASVGRLPRQRAGKSPTAPRRRREASMTQAMKDVASRRRNPPATRTGRKGIVIYFDQPVAAAIRRLGSDYSATNQDLGEMAFKYLFEKFGEPWPV